MVLSWSEAHPLRGQILGEKVIFWLGYDEITFKNVFKTETNIYQILRII